MRHLSGLIGITIAAVPAFASPPVPGSLSYGIYSNEEQVYFEKEAGRIPPPATTISVDVNGVGSSIDAFGAFKAMPSIELAMKGGDMVATLPNGQVLELRHARPVTCWASLKRDKSKPDGQDDWTFSKDIKLHDQGGRALVGKGEAGVKPIILRMRNVTWSGSGRSTNRPSLVLYVHTADDPDHAVSYVWSDPGAARLGVNLRWMQASCTVDGAEQPPEIAPKPVHR